VWADAPGPPFAFATGAPPKAPSRPFRSGLTSYDTLLVFLRMKSMRMNCPSVIVFVK
jgi:hypothetical protein